MNEQQYTDMKNELASLQAIDWEEEDVNWEYVDHRIRCLRADIFAYEHCQETAYNPYEKGIER